ncbi:AGAP010157-PA-like protein [Anopheles sinensis]|uniref:AGAP010157-PA-like protein n=1 Tax=Anopheles sinensis TaxID=74873 RepID=A0A084WGB4_ANOSI|nr:AGAP010157-PA-like protein [Anopheles sinensis]
MRSIPVVPVRFPSDSCSDLSRKADTSKNLYQRTDVSGEKCIESSPNRVLASTPNTSRLMAAPTTPSRQILFVLALLFVVKLGSGRPQNAIDNQRYV